MNHGTYGHHELSHHVRRGAPVGEQVSSYGTGSRVVGVGRTQPRRREVRRQGLEPPNPLIMCPPTPARRGFEPPDGVAMLSLVGASRDHPAMTALDEYERFPDKWQAIQPERLSNYVCRPRRLMNDLRCRPDSVSSMTWPAGAGLSIGVRTPGDAVASLWAYFHWASVTGHIDADPLAGMKPVRGSKGRPTSRSREHPAPGDPARIG